MQERQVLLLWPPAGSIHGPPMGLMAVAGFLRYAMPNVQIQIEDLNIQIYNHVLDSVPEESDIAKKLRYSWTQTELLKSVLSYWAFGDNSPGAMGALSDWECRYIAALFSDVLDGFIAGIVSPPDIVGISVCGNGLLGAIGLSDRLKEKFPDTIIVWGGVSVCENQAPEILANIPPIDAIVVGEGEQAFVELVAGLPEPCYSEIPGVLARTSAKNKKVIAARKEYLPAEPAYNLCDLSLYPALELPIAIGRGCAWGRCVFCNENYATSEFQGIDPKRSAQWALEWQKRFHPVSFELVDSAANSQRTAFNSFVAELNDGGGLREWRCMMRTRGVNKEDIVRAVQSGLRTIYFGIESFDDSVLQTMNKGETVTDHIRAFRIALECNLKVEGDLILFFPTDTAEGVQRTCSILEKYDHLFQHVSISFSRFVPVTQSEITLHPEEYGIIPLSDSLSLSQYLPPSLSDRLTPWDPKWQYIENENVKVKELAPAYLQLQGLVGKLNSQKPVTRTWYQLGDEVVLESFGYEGQALERFFLSNAQHDIWLACEGTPSTQKLAELMKIDADIIEEFLLMLADKGFIFGSSSKWTRAALHDSRFCTKIISGTS